MAYDFDRVIDRRHTESSKWRKYESDVLPMWVADMDFISPAPVTQALQDFVSQGVFGYPRFDGLMSDSPALRELVVERMARRYGWRVAPDCSGTCKRVSSG